MAVPLLFKMPVGVACRVIAGVVVALATVPAKPFALTTDTDVTVPEPPLPLLADVILPLLSTVILVEV